MTRLSFFLAELEKLAAEGDAKRLFKKFGKNKEFVIINNLKDRNQNRLARVMSHQANAESYLKSKLHGTSVGKERGIIAGDIAKEYDGALAGTLAHGKKGPRMYMARDLINKKSALSLRGKVHHEAFHGKVPLLGKSELLAYF